MFADKMSISELAKGLRQKDFSARELTETVLEQCEKHEPDIEAYITVDRDGALKQADRVDNLLAANADLPLLAGIPVALKDNIAVKGLPCTSGSKMLEHFRPPYDAYVWSKLAEAGAVLIGKTNLDEFGMGSSTENSYFKQTHNPHDLSRIPGGSSGGSAAAVAGGEAIYALGSDTGGSVRQPAAYCGIVGMRPTYGLVSRRGVTAFASSFDTVGPMSRTVRDNMIIMSAIAGHDRKDCSTVRENYKFSQDILNLNFRDDKKSLAGIRIALPQHALDANIDADIQQELQASVRLLESLGATVGEVRLDGMEATLSAYYVLSSAEASSNLARFDGVHFGYRSSDATSLEELYINSRSEALGYEVKLRTLFGNFALSIENYKDYFEKSQKLRTLLIRKMSNLFTEYDLMLMPTTTTTAYKIGNSPKSFLESSDDDILHAPVALAGLPAISLPCGQDSSSMPIGMQLVGKPFSENLIYRVAAIYEDQKSPAFKLAEVKA